MFRRFLYKIHFIDDIGVSIRALPTEIKGIFFFVLLVILSSVLFALQSVSKAAVLQPLPQIALTPVTTATVSATESASTKSNITTAPLDVTDTSTSNFTITKKEYDSLALLQQNPILDKLRTFYRSASKPDGISANLPTIDRDLCFVPRQKGEWTVQGWKAAGLTDFLNCYTGHYKVSTKINTTSDLSESRIFLQISPTANYAQILSNSIRRVGH